jgi:formate dehydrogenase alpha subunit
MAYVSLTIDDQPVSIPENATILGAAQQLGLSIPTLCHHPDLHPTGVCRICVVEVKGQATLAAACTTPVAPGMVVNTNTPAVQRARRTILELILASHGQTPEAEIGPDHGSLLQELVEELGVSEPRLPLRPRTYGLEWDDPLVVRDLDRCILCDRCVRVCADKMQLRAIWRMGHGSETRLTGAAGGLLHETDCEHCGNCVYVCPTGALSERWRYEFGPPEKKVRTICTYCGTGCGFFVNVRDNRIIGVSSDPDAPVNHGDLCIKGRFAFDFVHHPDRLTNPLLRERREDEFREVSWEEALEFVARRLTEIKERFGADSIGGISSSRCSNEENYLMQKFMRSVIGTNNIDNCARVCHSPSVSGLAAAFGSGAATNSLQEIEGAEVLLVVGSNTTEAHPIIAMKIKKAVVEGGAKLIVVDPRKIWLTRIADLWLPLLPGTDIALINGMLNVIIREGLYDEHFIQEKTEGFDTLRQIVEEYPPEKVEAITRVPAGDIAAAARLYASSKKSMIIYGLGVTEHLAGTYNVMACANLALATGNIGRPHTGVTPLRGQNNVQGACDMGALPNLYPAYESVSDEDARSKYEAAWGCRLPSNAGRKAPEMYAAALSGKVRAMYIMAEDPAVTDPDVNRVRKALEALDFLLVEEIFLTETAKLAHVVLPGASYVEKQGTFTNAERRVQLFHPAIDPVGDSKPDWQIICLLADNMGHPWAYPSPGEVWEEMASFCPDFAGINYERLEKGGLCWPCLSPSHPGTAILYKDGFPLGKGKFNDLPHLPPAELPDEEYPLLLTTGRRLAHHNNGSMTLRSPGLLALCPEELCEIHPEDAHRLGIGSGELVKVVSRRGEVSVKALVTDRSPPGVVFLSFHFPKVATNKLTGAGADLVTLTPEYKVSAVRVERAL